MICKGFNRTIFYLWILAIILLISTFSFSILLIRSKQHVMQYGYSIGRLEMSCLSYIEKNTELDNKILELSSVASLKTNNQSWTKDGNIRYIKKRDIQYFAFNKKLRNNQAVAVNLRKR